MTLPLIEEFIPGINPLEAFAVFRGGRYPFLLDGGMDTAGLGRYSFMGADPFLVMTSRGRHIRLRYDDREVQVEGNPFVVLDGLLKEYQLERGGSPLPFQGGAVGYLGYDLGRFIERLPVKAVDDLDLPECAFAFYDSILAYDNLEGRAWIVAGGFPEKTAAARQKNARRSVDRIRSRLEASKRGADDCPDTTPKPVKLRGGFTRDEYVAAVDRAREYIIAGDIFEVNLSQRFEADIEMSPYELFCRLRRVNPAPFACYQEFDELTVVSASPERFLKLQGDSVQTRPIKGTRPRGGSALEDEALAAELVASVKDRAENMMIVDLERNDLGRVCRFGSVRVTELAALEAFPTVFHLTSTVVGQLRPGLGSLELLQATFPGGSITGAPKIRAMEIIEELEPTRRGVYTGSIGYLGFNGDIDLNIAIRTIILKRNRACFQVGGAVVYDSDPEAEYQETMLKGRALMAALNAVTD